MPKTTEEILECWRYGLLPLTIYREAGGEPYEGKVAVAEVILNRVQDPRWEDQIDGVVLAPKQFSCYNVDDWTATRMPRPSNPRDMVVWEECCQAAAEALNGSNLTSGANHYLNENLTRKIRGGTLPRWFRPDKVTARINRHTFLKL